MGTNTNIKAIIINVTCRMPRWNEFNGRLLLSCFMIDAINASGFALVNDHVFSRTRLPSPVLKTRAEPLPEMTLVPMNMMFVSSKADLSFSPSETGVFRTDWLSPVRLDSS
jgi:hypothetical protein